MMKPLIITAALTGAGPLKTRTPHLPASPAEIVQEALAAWRAGAAVVHIHARTEQGEPTADVETHRWIARQIRDAGSDVILNFSAGDGGGRFGHEERLGLMDAGAEMVSYTASSYNSGARLYNSSPEFLAAARERMAAAGARPEIEVLDLGFCGRITRMIAAGELQAPFYCLFVFGIDGAMPADEALLPMLLQRLPKEVEWGIACAAEHAKFLTMQMMAFANGGHIRTGLEDQAYLWSGRLAESNAQLVEQWVSSAATWGRPVATASVARDMLGLRPL
ncbi:3-keto-5-aminohexanoate cleavage protein [Bosea caraganae]|uniref:3-keto-5-aminohexanoate cleavage protein n=1 Tax=Bosea caraganae TaxID=2763117 RepID=A0A370L9S5_9HYPH|nr:3-keto-5-aminohexanoate cleavage protein [Bosea caraganae]RDJ21916.1 3-keto-5-aminohexanoate cleavage protein [Bosea caraganae]RDJ28052.1 3-keto-5-aminohexanoate cleavage protein [Bosea caraganae]